MRLTLYQGPMVINLLTNTVLLSQNRLRNTMGLELLL